MINDLAVLIPVAGATLFWIIRLEVRLAKMENNLFWIKKEMQKCLQISGENTA